MACFSVDCPIPGYEMVAIPNFKDNYSWLLIHQRTQHAIVVDPGDGMATMASIMRNMVQVSAIFITHHHVDHSAGIYTLLYWLCAHDEEVMKQIPVYGPKREWIPRVNHKMANDDEIKIPDFKDFYALNVPGHTKGHLAYFTFSGLVFTGDTLFAGGCGRLFEGTPERLFNSLKLLCMLPVDTYIYCGHEYTEENLAFALTVEPNNRQLQERYKQTCALRAQNLATVPSILSVELETNPFLRTHSPEIQERVSAALGRSDLSEVEIFATLRAWKDKFVYNKRI